MDEIFKADFDDSEIIAKLEGIEKQLTETGKAGEAAARDMGAAFGQAEKQAGELGTAISNANKSVSEQQKEVKQAEKANSSWLQSIKQTIVGQQIGGKTLGEWAEQAKGFGQRIVDATKGVQGATIAQRAFNMVAGAFGGGIIAVVGVLIGYLTKFQGGMDKIAQATAVAGAVINTVLTRAVSLGGALGKIFSGDFKGAAEDAKAAISGIGAAILDTANAAFVLEKRIQALRDTTITSSVEIARQRAQLEELKAIVDDDTVSIGRRISVQKEAASVETDIAKKRFDQALEQQQIEQQRFALSTKTAADREAFAKAEIELTEAKKDLDLSVLSNEQKARELRKQAAEESKKAADERKKQLEEERKALEALNKDLQKLRLAALGEGLDAELFQVNQKFDELAKTAEEGIAKYNEIAARRGLTADELAKQKEFAELEKQIEEQRLGALLDVITEYAEKDAAIEREQEERKKALADKDLGRARAAAEAQRALRDEQINLTEQQNERFLKELADKGAKESDVEKARANLDKFIQAERLNNELQFQQNLLSITAAGDTEQIAQIEATIATIQAKIGNLQIDEPNPGKKGKGIYGLLGFTDEEGAAIGEATSQIVSAINEIAAARIAAAEARVEAINTEISAQEEAVNREAELAKEGVANNLAAEKTRLAELKKQRDAALKEEAKAKRAAILLDSVQQLSSLITASANIFKALSGLPFGLGVPVAVGLIAAMFGAFVAAKAKALKSVEPPKFRKGVKITGRTHEQGGEPLTDSAGNFIGEAEHGEWLIGTKPSKEHDKFLDRVNRNEFAGVDLNALLPRKSKYQDTTGQAASRVRDIEARKADVSDARQFEAMKAAYLQGSEKIVKAIEGRPETMPWKNGYKRQVKKGNVVHTEVVLPAD